MERRWLVTRRFALVLVVVAFGSTAWLHAQAQGTDVRTLLDRAQAAVKASDHKALVPALEQALEKARADAPLTINPFVLVTQPAKYYGDYAPRGSNVVPRGEALQFYLEPKNLVVTRAADGTYTPAFDVDLQILMTGGKVIGTQEKFGTFRVASRSPVQDIYMNLKVTLTGAPAGEYEVRFVVKDANSKKTATVSHPITMK
jgi:hypothetical protein